MSYAVSGSSLAIVLLAFAFGGCMKHHAKLETPPIAPPPGDRVLHTGRLWIEVRNFTKNTQCARVEQHEPICFDKVRDKLEASLASVLWPSFPDVEVPNARHRVSPGDYRLLVELVVEPLQPDATGPGWSAGARGHWRLLRDGVVLAGASFASRSRSEFGYGRPLAVAAGEAIDAVALHLGTVLGQLPETRPGMTPPVPRVATR
jgi:hypothetical protein